MKFIKRAVTCSMTPTSKQLNYRELLCFILKLPLKYKMTSGLSASVSLKFSCYKLPHEPIRKLTVTALGN